MLGVRTRGWFFIGCLFVLACGRTSTKDSPNVVATAGAAGGEGAAGAASVEPSVPKPNCAVDIAGYGGRHCGVYEDGSVWCWGAGIHGGAMDNAWANEPRRIEGIVDAARVVLGDAHSCAITNAGTLQCWGSNDAGQIDDSGESLVAYPAMVFDFPGRVRAVGLSRTQTCVLDILSHIYCRGAGGGVRQVEVPLAFDMPGPSTAVLDVDGLVFDIEPAEAALPRPELGRGNRALSAPNAPSCVLKRAGSVWCSDYRYDDTGDTLRARVDLGESVIQVGTGDLFMCALTNEDIVWCEGLNLFGQLGRGMKSTFEEGGDVPGLDNARRLSVGQQSACSLRADGSVWCWGAYRKQAPTAVATRVSACDGQKRPVPVLELAAPRNSAARLGAAGLARGQALCECAFGDAPQEGCVGAEDFAPNAACLEALAPNHEAWDCAAERLWREAQCYDASNECSGRGLVPNCSQSIECPIDVTWSRIASYCGRGACSESGEPVNRAQLCDGTVDCEDGSDERNCAPAQEWFDCGEEQTTAVSRLCDGVADCANSADERCF